MGQKPTKNNSTNDNKTDIDLLNSYLNHNCNKCNNEYPCDKCIEKYLQYEYIYNIKKINNKYIH